jgi:hypothetical protein
MRRVKNRSIWVSFASRAVHFNLRFRVFTAEVVSFYDSKNTGSNCLFHFGPSAEVNSAHAYCAERGTTLAIRPRA